MPHATRKPVLRCWPLVRPGTTYAPTRTCRTIRGCGRPCSRRAAGRGAAVSTTSMRSWEPWPEEYKEMSTMRAIQVTEHGGPEVLKVYDVPIPEPGPGHVRVKVEAAGINFIDVYQRSG